MHYSQLVTLSPPALSLLKSPPRFQRTSYGPSLGWRTFRYMRCGTIENLTDRA